MLCAADLAKNQPAKYLPLPSPKELELLNIDELVLVAFCNREDVWCAAACGAVQPRFHSTGLAGDRLCC